MSWPIKLTFRPNPDKEITKEIKIDPQSTILVLLFKACELFDLMDAHNYAISFKKAVLPLLDSLREAKLVQGNTVTLTRNIKLREKREIMFNFKIHSDSGPMNLIARYNSEENFISCLRSVPSGSSNQDLLKHNSKLPIVTILSAKLTAQDLMKISNFKLESLGLKGNYLVSINYIESNENYSEFSDFLDGHRTLKHEIAKTNNYPVIEKNTYANILPAAPKNASINSSLAAINVNEISYEIFSQSKDSLPAPDVPDSFFDLSKDELLGFQRGLQNISKSINERSFASTKTKMKIDASFPSKLIPIKLVFDKQIFVQADFSPNWLVGSIVEFIEGVIFESHEGNIELWTGIPCKHLSNMQKSINESGITGPTRIVVNCKRYTFRKNLVINKK